MITATIIPVQDRAGNVRDVWLRGEIETLGALGRFMDRHELSFAGDWHSFQQPSFMESIEMAQEYGIGLSHK